MRIPFLHQHWKPSNRWLKDLEEDTVFIGYELSDGEWLLIDPHTKELINDKFQHKTGYLYNRITHSVKEAS